jgi:2-dehydro-3-deoxy-D-arabinonate dehydratase
MKAYQLLNGIVLEQDDQLYLAVGEDWNNFINDDEVLKKAINWIQSAKAVPVNHLDESALKPPIGRQQELWACGVTYLRSKIGRQEESKDSGGADFYAKVYEAERPEVFFKATPHRVVGHGEKVRIRKDSTWDVPEPELTLVVTSSGKIIGYTIGNDMSSRSIEGENPLYLPQAKTYDGCAAVGPCVYISDVPIDKHTEISLTILRNNNIVFNGSITLAQMKRTAEELVSFVYREASFPFGCLIMTGTGIVPDSSFTLQSDDEIKISISSIGTLVNSVA